MAEVKIIAERCKNALRTVLDAVLAAFAAFGNEYVVPVNMEACVACCQGAYICPDGAIEIYK